MSAKAAIWLVGCGNMGGAMLRGWIDSGVDPQTILVIDPASPKLPAGVRLATKAQGRAPDILLLGIKPQRLAEIAPTLAIGAHTLVVSILAGVETQSLKTHLPGAAAYVRVMPNMPAAIGEGVSVIFGPTLDADGKAQIDKLMTPLGHVEWVDQEDAFHAVTGVSGSGPAFVFRFIDALAKAGVVQGLSHPLALRLALETVAGSARLALSAGQAPSDLTEAVRSPNGTTHAGLTVLDGSDLAELMAATVAAAAKRSRELADAARAD